MRSRQIRVDGGCRKGVVPGRGADYHAYAPKISSPEWLKPNIQTRLPVEESRRPSISIFNPRGSLYIRFRRLLSLSYGLSLSTIPFLPLVRHVPPLVPRFPRFFSTPWFCVFFFCFFFFVMLEGRRVADIHRGNSWLKIFTVTDWNLLSLYNSILRFLYFSRLRYW